MADWADVEKHPHLNTNKATYNIVFLTAKLKIRNIISLVNEEIIQTHSGDQQLMVCGLCEF